MTEQVDSYGDGHWRAGSSPGRVTFRAAAVLGLAVAAGLWTVAAFAGDQADGTPTDSKGWIVLFGGKTLNGWGAKRGDETGEWMVAGKVALDPRNNRKFAIEPGRGVLVNGTKGRTRNLFTAHRHGDVEAHIEFVVPKGSNSGVYFQGRYEIQILDSYGVEKPKYGDCGGIYRRLVDGKTVGGHPPRENASKPPGQWQTFDVVFRAPRFDEKGKKTENARFVKVVHNGVVIHEDVEVTGPTRAAAFGDEKPTGPLMLQGDHGPVAYRNLRVKPIEIP